MLGVRDRMEIWDRGSYERYEAAYAGAYQAGTLEPERRNANDGLPCATGVKLGAEVRQSLSLDRDDGAHACRLDRVRIVRRARRVTERAARARHGRRGRRAPSGAPRGGRHDASAPGGHAAACWGPASGTWSGWTAIPTRSRSVANAWARSESACVCSGLAFSEIDEEAVGGPADGVLFDLGVSSMQLDRAERGFSFRQDAPLDMRMAGGADDEPTAADLVNGLPERELADLLYRFGDERRSRRIAAAIVRHRPITTTDQLAGVVVGAVGRRPGGPHPARRTFQALRIAVNRELEELTASLPHAAGLLGPGGRVVVIAYHSLEDGIVKRAFRDDTSLAASSRRSRSSPRPRSARRTRVRAARSCEPPSGGARRRMSEPARKLDPVARAQRVRAPATSTTAQPSARTARAAAARPPHPSPPQRVRARRGSPVAFWVLAALVAAALIVGDRLAVGVVRPGELPGRRSAEPATARWRQQHEVLREQVGRGLLAAARDAVGARARAADARPRRDRAASSPTAGSGG